MESQITGRRGLVLNAVQERLYRWQEADRRRKRALWPTRGYHRSRAEAGRRSILDVINRTPAFVLVLATSVPARGGLPEQLVQGLPPGEYMCIRRGTAIASPGTSSRIELEFTEQVIGHPRYTVYLEPEDIHSVYRYEQS